MQVGWQIDPFGHSSTQASLLSAVVGFDAVFFARADYADLALRKAAHQADFLWRPSSATFGDTADVFTGNFPNHYGPPSGFNFDWGQHDPPIIVCPPSSLPAWMAVTLCSWSNMLGVTASMHVFIIVLV